MAAERPVGKTRDAGWEIGVSRTVAAPAPRVWALLASARGQAIWLGAGARLSTEKGAGYETEDGTVGEVRSFRPLDRIRVTWKPPDWDHDTTVQVAIRAQGEQTLIRLHQERLAGAAEREQQRRHWSAVMDEIVTALP
jgi:uncharacterized protein YndB with AHSA1/START domain